ncbi:MAG: lipoate--protein ligase [Mogibacterium sp.]|nr:lipoate--protein ligase [Mogibacterium sp.]
MYFLETRTTDPYDNLAAEERLMDTVPRGEGGLMLWQNDRTIVVGKYQNTADEINAQSVEEPQIRVARRLSGGGAVYHDLGNLNYTIIEDQEGARKIDFAKYISPVIRTLEGFGISAEFTGRNDIVIGGKKISGNAQYSRNGRILHHGCILLDSDLGVVQEALRVSPAKYASRGVRSIASRVTTINACAPRPITMEEFRTALAGEILREQDVTPVDWTPEDLGAIRKLRERYASWEWIYGARADYAVRKQRRFDAGTVTADLDVRKGRIERIRITGDFFGNGEIAELEAKLTGAELNGSLRALLADADVPAYIQGMTSEELYELLAY